ncbi:lanthionine synthetase LanC family protein [Rhizohabitans arisaemae]|uniref:lanthionine synthetase LanC family protein n=1 Tax=Rhizohabitans arisaemae TaxID=2720610 RepID=UPI0024B125F5|nr:lanthionine synthetase LanC family protein [Rhizohabitans arisaemae]
MNPAGPRPVSPVEAAIAAGRWVRGAAVDGECGRYWRANPDSGGRGAVPGSPASLYSGAAGIVVFFLELAAATGHDAYLDDALAGARYLAATWRRHTGLGLYQGLGGIVFALAETGWATGDESVMNAARDSADHIMRNLRSVDGGVGWSGDPAQSGDGGVVLALLHAAGALGVPAYRDGAAEAGLRIAAFAVPGHGYPAPAELPRDAVTPGFLHGTAGTTFLCARLFGVTGDHRFLAAARRGAAFIRMTSVVEGDTAFVPHHVPQARDLHYLGFCSGSAGVARAFYELYRVGGDVADLQWAERLARGIVRGGSPGPGKWNVVCQCCGTAGIMELFLGLFAVTGAGVYLAYARHLGLELIRGATDHDRAGFRWYQAYTRCRPWEVTADTGFMVGAAGIGTAFLHLSSAIGETDPRRLILLPDNPFPAIALPAEQLRALSG